MSLTTAVNDWFVSCPAFVEPLLAEELQALGAEQVRPGHAGVHAQGSLVFAYRTLLWSRLASRVTLQLAAGSLAGTRETGPAEAEALRTLLQTIDWSDHLRPEGSLRVRFSGRSDDFRNTRYGAQWVKDQVVEQFLQHHGVRPSVSDTPELVIVVNLHKGRATIGIELNAVSLHVRGYRDPGAAAPLRENLAAAVLCRAGWPEQVRTASPEHPVAFVDPMCGSGTLLLEAALMALDCAPGLIRENSLNRAWPGNDPALWQELVTAAEQRRVAGLQQADRFQFWGNDAADVVYNQARQSWRQLGLPEARWTRAPIDRMPASPETDQGLVVVNPPYGERLGDPAELAALYQALGSWLQTLEGHWQAAILLPDTQDIRQTGLFYSRRHPMRNGQLDCRLYRFERLQARQASTIEPVPDLANRLRKNLRRLKPFLRQQITDAYRVYDADLPEYAVAIDRYGDWLHVQEYAPPATIETATAARRLEEAVVTAAATLDVPRERIALKQRRQQKGQTQYSRQDKTGQQLEVMEHGASLEVNLLDYLDTGLFLDHRPARYWLRQQADGKRVLNLFSYTGVAGVQAALGGATRVDNVDLSATYLAWAKRNFERNGVAPARVGYHRADVMAWLAAQTDYWDLIFLDPPTFSNSSRLDSDFEVQRDHEQLLHLAMSRLNPEGVLLFSNNYRRFRLSPGLTERYQVSDWQQPSLPPDFKRNPRIHRCWHFRHPALWTGG